MNTAQRQDLKNIVDQMIANNDMMFELYQKVNNPADRALLAAEVHRNNESIQRIINLLKKGYPSEGANDEEQYEVKAQ